MMTTTADAFIPHTSSPVFDVRIKGQPLDALPKDLYIPPEALEVFLEAFQGPLDLLLYLIQKHRIDILDIPMTALTEQYLKYVDLMKHAHLELAAEYLVMAAMLAEIKSRMLLPRPPAVEEIEEDPRAALVRRLQEYERFKKAALQLDELPRQERDTFSIALVAPERPPVAHPPLALQELLVALADVMKRADLVEQHLISAETLTVREAMTYVLERVTAEQFTPFESLFQPNTGRAGVIVTFLALLELLREAFIELVQTEPFAPIHVRAIAC